jgi:hypothetical protein
MKRTLTIIGLGLTGMALAVAVSVAAFALVGEPLSEPATGEIRVPTTSRNPSDDATDSRTPSPSRATPTASPSDDHGGNDGSGGSGENEPGDDNGGGGENEPGDDNSGHGSDD